jgi:hypothetical protein
MSYRTPQFEFIALICRQCLDRKQRALCRVLVLNHSVPRAILRDYFGCAQSTISKAVENQYAQPDHTEKDDEILLSDPNFEEILKEVSKLNVNIYFPSGTTVFSS